MLVLLRFANSFESNFLYAQSQITTQRKRLDTCITEGKPLNDKNTTRSAEKKFLHQVTG